MSEHVRFLNLDLLLEEASRGDEARHLINTTTFLVCIENYGKIALWIVRDLMKLLQNQIWKILWHYP